MNTTINIETLTTWDEGKVVSGGSLKLRKGPATPYFWSQWRNNQPTLKAAGISCGKDRKTGQWEALWWINLDENPATVEASQPVALQSGSTFTIPDRQFSLTIPEATAPIEKVEATEKVWSNEQKAIFEFFKTGTGNAIVWARAGTGKTTTI